MKLLTFGFGVRYLLLIKYSLFLLKNIHNSVNIQMLIKPYKLQVPVIGRGGGMLGAEEWRGEGAPSRGRAKGQCGGGGGAAGAWWGGGWTICPKIFF